jgi:hypothetical protein
MYGACGGGHHDLRPYYGSRNPRAAADDAKVLGPLIAAAKAAAAPTPSCRRPLGSFAVLTKGERDAARDARARAGGRETSRRLGQGRPVAPGTCNRDP